MSPLEPSVPITPCSQGQGVRRVSSVWGGHLASRRLAFCAPGQTLTLGFIQINEMKSAGSPDLITAIHSLVVNNLCNKGLRLLQCGGGCGSAFPWRRLQELET